MTRNDLQDLIKTLKIQLCADIFTNNTPLAQVQSNQMMLKEAELQLAKLISEGRDE